MRFVQVAFVVLVASTGAALAYPSVDRATDCRSSFESSFIDAVCTNATERLAWLQLNGRWYSYCDIPASVAIAVTEALSPGRVYNERIKGRYRCDPDEE